MNPFIHPTIHSFIQSFIHPTIHHPLIIEQKTRNNIDLPTNWAYGRLSHARGPLLNKSLREFKPRQRLSRTTTNKLNTHTHTHNQPYIQAKHQSRFYSSTIHPPIQATLHPYTYLPVHSPYINSSTYSNNPPSTHSPRPPLCNRIPCITFEPVSPKAKELPPTRVTYRKTVQP